MKLETAYQQALKATSGCVKQVALADTAKAARDWADAASVVSRVLCDLDLLVRASHVT